ncbi:MAG: DUF3987 domain-containing protein [Candidatus Hydrogenedentes bacterium]|nr:DUF3987 domain-containing protein [Candidatus Hydrogenedentota bacterium]
MNGKIPAVKGWPEREFAEDELLAHVDQGGNIGIKTGEPSNVDVLDCDDPELQEALVCRLPETVTATTGRGLHFYFAHHPDVRNRADAGDMAGEVIKRDASGRSRVDTRSTGGCCVFPGSLHPERNTPYQWAAGLDPDSVAVAEWPGWLLLSVKKADPAPPPARPITTGAPEHGGAYARAALSGELEAVAGAIEGQRNHQLNASACKLGGLVGAGLLDEGEVTEALVGAALGCGLSESEARKTIFSGLAAGVRTPRSLPEPRTAPRPLSTGPNSEKRPDGPPATPTGESPTEEPIPLTKALAAPRPFPTEALGPILGPAAQALADGVQVPVAMAASSLLAASALAAQGLADVVMPDGRRLPLSLFLLTVAISGDRKSAVDRLALRPHRAWQHRRLEDHATGLAAWKNAHEGWAAARAEAKKKSKSKTAVALEQALADVGPEPPRPPAPVMVIANLTIEGLQKSLAADWPTVGVFSDEGGSLIGGYSFGKDQQLKSLAELSLFWDASGGVKVRAGDGVAICFGRRVALHLMAQPDPARQLLGNELAHGQGLLPRFLVLWPSSLRGTRSYKPTDPADTPEVRRYYAAMETLLEAPLDMDPMTRELKLRVIAPTPEAMAAWVRFHDFVEGDNNPGGPLDAVAGWASKAAEHALRLAGVLAMVNDPDAEHIGATAMAGGIALADFFLGEMLRLRSESAISPELLKAERLGQWLRRQGRMEMSASEIVKGGPCRTADELDAAMEVLGRHGWVRRIQVQNTGRPSKRWEIIQHEK